MSSDTLPRAFHPSHRFVISCGTVPIDIARGKILLARKRSTNKILLPKGRKDENECLKAAALRETFEETGYSATILPLKLPTHATNRSGNESHTEPIAVTQREKDHVLKLIFWYAASVNSEAARKRHATRRGGL